MKDKKKKNKEKCKWEVKAEEYLVGWKRAQADYQNREREIAEEKLALRGLVEENTVSDFLPVLDNLKKATSSLRHSHEDGNSVNEGTLQGIEYVIKQFEDKLSTLGIEKMDLLGKEFDPNLAEAVEKKGDGDNVIEIILDGYVKDKKIIRPAKVIVGQNN